MNIIKRSGMEAEFDPNKIKAAVDKANATVNESERLTSGQIYQIVGHVIDKCEALHRAPSVEEIQDMVEEEIMRHQAYKVANHYITYRFKRALVRKANSTDQQILSLIERNNEEVMQENAFNQLGHSKSKYIISVLCGDFEDLDSTFKKNKNIINFIILDDDTDMEPHQLPYFLKTNANGSGLNKTIMNKAIKILNDV